MFANIISQLRVFVDSFSYWEDLFDSFLLPFSISTAHFSCYNKKIDKTREDAKTALTQQKKEIRKLTLI
jgi:hypothetical protein